MRSARARPPHKGMSARRRPAVNEADALYEMVNIYPADSGLPMTVWAGPRGKARHDVTDQQLTPLQRRLIDAAADIIETQADSPEFLHSVWCQVGLPRTQT